MLGCFSGIIVGAAIGCYCGVVFCFVFLTISNVMLVLDKTTPTIDLSSSRMSTAFVGMLILIYGLINDAE